MYLVCKLLQCCHWYILEFSMSATYYEYRGGIHHREVNRGAGDKIPLPLPILVLFCVVCVCAYSVWQLVGSGYA